MAAASAMPSSWGSSRPACGTHLLRPRWRPRWRPPGEPRAALPAARGWDSGRSRSQRHRARTETRSGEPRRGGARRAPGPRVGAARGRAWTRARGCPGTPPEASGCLDPAARRPPASGPAPCGTLPGSWTPADRVHPTPSCSRPPRRPPAPPNAARSRVYRSHCDLTGPPARLSRSPAPRTHRSSGEGGRRCQPRADPFAGRTV